VHGDVERGVGDEVLETRPLTRRIGEPHDAGLGVQGGEQHRGEVARRVAEAVLDLQAEPDLATVARHGRRGHR
jgi:hypothetical protein